MIAHVIGKVAEKFNSSVIVDVGGVGYEVCMALGDFENVTLDEETKFYTYHHIREQSQELYGFSSLIAKKIFELLITVQGVGPKAALAILSLGDIDTIRGAIASADSIFISKATGVGKKTAERVVIDLSDKVGFVGEYQSNVNKVDKTDEALEALMALGYNLNDASKSLEKIDDNLSTSDRVKLALKGNM